MGSFPLVNAKCYFQGYNTIFLFHNVKLMDILRLTLVEFVVDGETLNFHCHLEGL